jgi:16S rRNA G966 N2-methylase RsmD
MTLTESKRLSAEAEEHLAGQLDRLRGEPGYPDGTDEAIIRMSSPPTYTACPNPYIEDWVKEIASNKPAAVYIDPGPFTTDISEGKGSLFYKAHSYPTKVPHQAIMRFILHYTNPGDVILDGFCGSGMAGLAAQACGRPDGETQRQIEAEMGPVRWGSRRAVLQDLSPSATFIAAGLNLPINSDEFDRRSAEILEEFDVTWGWMYETTHKDGRKAQIDYTVWSEVFTCPMCAAEIVFYDVASDEKTGKVSESFRCPACGADLTKDRLDRRKVAIRSPVGDTAQRIEFRPVRIQYRIGKATHTKRPDDLDMATLRRIAATPLPGWVPSQALPIASMTHGSRLAPKGFTHIHQLWPDRALMALAALWASANAEADPLIRLALLFWIEQAFWGLSWMNRYQPIQQGRLGGSQVNRQMTGVYYVPSLTSECSPRYNLGGSRTSTGKRSNLVKTWAVSPAELGLTRIATASSTKVPVPDSSIDYVFVDPPFGANIPYADLGLLVESWHRVLEATSEEAILDTFRHKGIDEYQALMEECFREFHRVLKPGRWMTVEFSNSSNEVWLVIQAALSAAGFVVADTRVIDKEQLSYRQVTAKNAVKRDLIISTYKPGVEIQGQFSLSAGSTDGVWAFIREHLGKLPVFVGKRGQVAVVRERLPDRLYDRVLAFHIHHHVTFPLTAAEFYEGLDQRFPVRDGMFFLSSQVEQYERARLTVKDLLQSELFITNEASAVQWLRQQLKTKPRSYADIQPPFLTELQDGVADWEALPDLKELLEENFLQDNSGRWYVPDPKRAEDLDRLRAKTLTKEFASYAGSKGKLNRFRSEAIYAGFREAWARRDYATIASVGGRLPDELYADEPGLHHYYKVAESQLR